MTRTLLHIGYHKTATTWLQEVLFNDTEKGFYSPWNRSQITEDFIKPNALTFNPLKTIARYENGISKAAQDNLVATVSHERLSGYPASGGFDSKLIADRLFASFEKASVLIIIREQKSIIRSWYQQYIKDGGSMSLSKSLDLPHEAPFRVPHFTPDFYKYDALINYYQNLFTKDKVLVLPFELLAADPTNFVERIIGFTGIEKVPSVSIDPHNKGRGVLRTVTGRYGNRLFALNQLNTCALINWPWMNQKIWRLGSLLSQVTPAAIENSFERRTKAYIKQYTGDCYKESNQKTSELIDIDLSTFNYDC
ncbi:sulfotransferase domain-containing protein [Pseudomonadales bacterium]|nr:sulfotransferase domain-containing protein [Pseudomonadales bacterium]